ncbi:MAG: hypothetical protein CW338_10445 [Clostridiales bacterium]|nr:hypothetical protein [Clostridiales bacterium]
MNIYVPDYYDEFRCTASACRHTCCAGWEIDIDEESLERYEKLQGQIGERVRASISREGEPHFRLTPEERCPLLNENGLCDLYTACGAESLCQICTDHPRFRNFFTERVEIGLGMVCEEAARLILSRPRPMTLVLLSGTGKGRMPEEELQLLSMREKLFEQVPDIAGNGPEARLLEYLVFRHIADALYDDRLDERIAFVKAAWEKITEGRHDWPLENLAERCRVFSDRVEYDDEVLAELKIPDWLF